MSYAQGGCSNDWMTELSHYLQKCYVWLLTLKWRYFLKQTLNLCIIWKLLICLAHFSRFDISWTMRLCVPSMIGLHDEIFSWELIYQAGYKKPSTFFINFFLVVKLEWFALCQHLRWNEKLRVTVMSTKTEHRLPTSIFTLFLINYCLAVKSFTAEQFEGNVPV